MLSPTGDSISSALSGSQVTTPARILPCSAVAYRCACVCPAAKTETELGDSEAWPEREAGHVCVSVCTCVR